LVPANAEEANLLLGKTGKPISTGINRF